MRLRVLGWVAIGLVVPGCVDDPINVTTESESSTTMEGTSSTTMTPSTSASSSTTVNPSTTVPMTDSDSDGTSTGIVVETGSTTDEPNTGSTTNEVTAGTSTGEPPMTSTTTDGTTFGMDTSAFVDTGIIFIDPTGGPELECDLWEQDCPGDEKCMPWANDGGNSWNAWRCSPIDPAPDQIGDTCTVEGSGVSGVDSCDIGQMCWDVDAETNEGTCIGFCEPPQAAPTCAEPDAFCVITNDGILPLCLPGCDPLMNDCPDEQICVGVDDAFVCAPDASGEMGVYGDPCEFLNTCDAGLACMDADLVPDCFGAAGCCSPYCDVSAPICPDPELECSPWYDEGTAPDGYEDVGICIVP